MSRCIMQYLGKLHNVQMYCTMSKCHASSCFSTKAAYNMHWHRIRGRRLLLAKVRMLIGRIGIFSIQFNSIKTSSQIGSNYSQVYIPKRRTVHRKKASVLLKTHKTAFLRQMINTFLRLIKNAFLCFWPATDNKHIFAFLKHICVFHKHNVQCKSLGHCRLIP